LHDDLSHTRFLFLYSWALGAKRAGSKRSASGCASP
jgi:hypothetical protein